jgi:hypothetical protein
MFFSILGARVLCLETEIFETSPPLSPSPFHGEGVGGEVENRDAYNFGKVIFFCAWYFPFLSLYETSQISSASKKII